MAKMDTILPDFTLSQLRQMLASLGVKRLLVKELAPNDNSKNQPYLSGSMDVTNILPVGDIRVSETKAGNRILKAPLPLHWLQPDGTSAPAPNAKLILYPQYPEVRFSGFLLGARNAPSSLMSTRMSGRLLFFGITELRTVIAWAVGPGSRIARELGQAGGLEQVGVFRNIPLDPTGTTSRQRLLAELRRIHLLGWIASKALRSDGSLLPCLSSNCVGYTLEAELGIARNGIAEPDYLGWEVKASQVDDCTRPPASKALTLFTPEPTGGYYRSNGVEAFVRKYGYPDKRGRKDRINFGGIFRAGKRHQGTGLSLVMSGFDVESHAIVDPAGSIALISDTGEVAAEWSFQTIINIWNRKHAQAVYVPAEVRVIQARQYRYGMTVNLGEGTNFNRFLGAVAAGKVCFDPGIKVEEASTDTPSVKRRSQFRVRFGDLSSLYDRMTSVSVLSD